MMSKIRNLLVFGVGYVFGAQAGRARYEQIKQQATRVVEHPRAQQLVHQAREKATSRMSARLGGSGGAPVGRGAANGTTPMGTTSGVTPDSTIDLTADSTTIPATNRPSHL